jgi:hypothetical protein
LRLVEHERDERADPVLDWRVSWAADGSAIGIWVAESVGATWGSLSVMSVGRDDDAAPLLAPTLARRGFTLGPDRVAWIAPSEEDPEGELRVRTWGEHGPGGIRIRGLEVDELLPGF